MEVLIKGQSSIGQVLIKGIDQHSYADSFSTHDLSLVCGSRKYPYLLKEVIKFQLQVAG